jgi:hypothetical protein
MVSDKTLLTLHSAKCITTDCKINLNILKLVVCILLLVLGQVQGFRLTQHWFGYFIYLVTATCFGLMTIFRWNPHHLLG